MKDLKDCGLGGEKAFVGNKIQSLDVLNAKDRTNQVVLDF